MHQDFFLSVDRSVIAVAIPLAIVTASVLVVNQIARIRRTSALHKTIRDAVNANHPLAPSLIAKLDEKPSHEGDARTGIVLLAVAVGMILFGLIQGGPATLRSFVAVAMFPGAVGAALFGRARLATRTDPVS
ncbi:MAG TPA: hypothetical protein VGB70_03995 [Allosphingosinicella sp.]|jgi:hypothetical protein